MYSPTVMDHFANPRNVGDIADADGTGEVGNAVCGDMMTFSIKVTDGRLSSVKFSTFGCGAAIAVSSMVSEMATGKTIDEALQITNATVAKELGGLPKHKMHCSNLGADALHKAIEDYKSRSGEATAHSDTPASRVEHAPAEADTDRKSECHCPYCDHELSVNDELCKPCGARISHCASCREAVPSGQTLCAECSKEA